MKPSEDVEAVRRALTRLVEANHDRVVDICRRLIRVPSENPPGDTRAIADVAADILSEVPGATVDFVTAEYPIVNVMARMTGRRAGRRLVFNGHLDTYPIGDPSLWSVDPLAGVEKEGRLYGRGVSDMKGGIACSLLAFLLLAEHRDAWSGEVVVTLAGDEETMGRRGTGHLLETEPHAGGDAMICGDAGSPRVLRFGEKGMIWLDVTASGRAAHGAHVHLGENAIERLMEAVSRLMTLRRVPAPMPPEVNRAMRKAKTVSENISGSGETKVLKSVTVNCGVVDGGAAPNLVPDRARASLDIRLPVGVSVADIERRIAEMLDPLEGVAYRINRRYEANWTDPDHEIVRCAVANGKEILGNKPVVNMRVGASDSRLYRLHGIPSIVCGLTPYNMGGPDEFITFDDLFAVAHMHTLTAFDFLSARRDTDEHAGKKPRPLSLSIT
jgi:succinyl-diaminopimelate desuccinylase